MNSDEVNEVKNEEVPEVVNNEINEEVPEEAIQETETSKIEEIEEQPKPKAKPKKLERSVKIDELVECSDYKKKHTNPHYYKGQPTETLPVNKQQANYGNKIKEQFRKEIENELKTKYEKKETSQIIQYSEPIGVKGQQRSIKMKEPEQPRQPTA